MPYPTYDRWKPVVIKVSAWVLAISASMILGLLSFSGMLAICPALTLAYAAFLFAIVIEGEIYLQSTLSALFKLTDPKAYEHQLSALYILEKMVDFDKNRDLLLMREPNDEDKKQVCDHNQVLIIRKDDHVEIGFRNQLGEYEQKEVAAEHSGFLKHYSPEEQFIEVPEHHEHIQGILQRWDSAFSARPQQQYPLFMKAYVSQCQYVRRLNCYSHTQPANEESQKELATMTAHLKKLDDDISDELFHGSQGRVAQSADPYFSFDWQATKTSDTKRATKKSYDLNFETMTFQPKSVLRGMTAFNRPTSQIEIVGAEAYSKKPIDFKDTLKEVAENDPFLTQLGDKTYEFHHRKLAQWISADRDVWKRKLAKHTLHSRLAFVVSAFSGLIMGIGTTYLIMESMAAIPLLAAIPLSFFPPVIGPLALIAGVAYGLLIYNSLTDILLDDPFKKFFDRVRSNMHYENMTLKKGLMLGLSLLLFLVTIFLTICTAGTWLTVFHKTKPLFTWISHIPNILLNVIIPILIGISVLPFSVQSISNTLENLEGNPTLDTMVSALNPANWHAPTWRFPRNWAEASAGLSEKIWQHWVPDFLGVTADEFAKETREQQYNPYRILYRLLFEPLRIFIFIGHLISAGATSDQIQGVPVIFSFILNFFFECAEDWDWIWGRAHVNNMSTADLLRERAQKADDHNHDKNIPMRILNFMFEPILKRAAQWDNDHRRRPTEGDNLPIEEDNVPMRYERIKRGHQPKDAPTAAPEIPSYRKQSNFNLFLFKSGVYEASAPIRDTCCTNLLTARV